MAKSDPTKEPNFQKVIQVFLSTPHRPHIGAYMQTTALDLISDAIDNLCEPLRSDHPLQGEKLDGIEEALQEIASALADRKEPAGE